MSPIGIIALIWVAFVIILVFLFAISGLFTSKGTEKFLKKNAEIAIKAQNNIINDNQEMLKDTANKTADIHKDAVKTIVHAAKEGWSDESTIFCKHCGAQIDADSTFCKKCGKQL